MLELIQSIQLIVWVALFIFILFLFSDKQLWEYEVKFPLTEGVGRGEIEIEYYKKAKGSIDIELELDPNYHNKSLDIFLEDIKILNIPADKNTGPRLRLHEVYTHTEPHEGMIIKIKHNEQAILFGPLIMD